MDEIIIKFAYDMAFRDSTMRKVFSKKEDESDTEFQNRKSVIKEKAYFPVQQYIENIFNNHNPDPLETIINISEL